jgi:hypothetical protein
MSRKKYSQSMYFQTEGEIKNVKLKLNKEDRMKTIDQSRSIGLKNVRTTEKIMIRSTDKKVLYPVDEGNDNYATPIK